MDKEIKNLDIKDVLPETILEGLSELHKSDLQSRLDQIVESRVNEKIAIATKSAEVSYDAMMNERLEKVLGKMEESYKRGLKEVYNHLKRKERERVVALKESYRNIIKRKEESHKAQIKQLKESTLTKMEINSDRYRRNLTNVVLNFVEDEVAKHVPTDQLRESIKNDKAMIFVKELKSMLNVDEASARKEIKQPLTEALCIMKKNNSVKRKLSDENAKLQESLNQANERLAKAERDAFLNEKLATIPSIDQRNYMKRICEGADKQWIADNWDISCKYFQESLNAEREALAKQTQSQRRSLQVNTKTQAGVGRIASALNEQKKVKTGKSKMISESAGMLENINKQSRLSSIFKDIEYDENSGM